MKNTAGRSGTTTTGVEALVDTTNVGQYPTKRGNLGIWLTLNMVQITVDRRVNSPLIVILDQQ